jgi:large subunit ribosomal protein L30
MKAGMKVRVKQVRSIAGRTPDVVATVRALGLGKIGRQRDFVLNDSVWGMLKRIRHLVQVFEAN